MHQQYLPLKIGAPTIPTLKDQEINLRASLNDSGPCYKGFTGAVTVTGAAADAVTVAVAVRGSGELRFPETERETAWRFPEIYRYQYYRTLPPAGRILTAGQCPPMSSGLTRTIPPDSDYRVITGYSMVSMDSMVSGYIPCIFQGFLKF